MKRGKRILAGLFIPVLLMISLLAGNAAAVTLSIGSVTKLPGEQVSVPVTLDTEGAGVGGFQVTFGYDSNALSAENCSSTIEGALFEPNFLTPGEVGLGLFVFSSLPSGTIINCIFTISPSAVTGTLPLDWFPDGSYVAEVYDDTFDNNIISATFFNGAVTVEGPPTITSFTLPVASATLLVPVTSFTATDNTAVSDYCLTETNNQTTCGWSTTPPINYTFGTQGLKILYAFAKDTAGYVSSPVSATVTVDLPPTVTSFVLPTAHASLTVPVTALAVTDNGAVDYCLSESDSAGSCVWSATLPVNYTFGTPGSKTLYAFAKDSLGRISTPLSATVTVDLPPAVTAFTLPATSASLTVPVTFTATDNGTLDYCVTESATSGSCVWNITQPADYTFATQGAKILYAFARDNIGNISTRAQAAVVVDLPPVVTALALQDLVADMEAAVTTFTVTDNGTVSYCLTESDTPAGCIWSSAKPATYTFGTLGSKTLFAFAKDNIDQISISRSATVIVEARPTVSFTLPSASTTLTVPVTFTATDNGTLSYCVTESASSDSCVWSATPPANYTFATQGSKTLYAFAKDNAGYVSTPGQATVTVDLPPTITAFVLPAMVPDLVVPLSFTATDNDTVSYCLSESGTSIGCNWSATPPVSYTFASLGLKTLHAFARDNAGSVTDHPSATVTIEARPAITSFSLPAEHDNMTIPVFDFIAQDNGSVSGYCLTESATADSCIWSATPPENHSFSSPGEKTLYAFVKDNVGYVSEPASLTVMVLLRLNLNISVSGTVPGTVTTVPIEGAMPESITCADGTCAASFLSGSTITLDATPAWYGDVQWSGCTTADNTECQVLMDADKDITATFVPQGNARLTVTQTALPTIQEAYNAASGGSIELKEQDLITFLEVLEFNRNVTITLDGGKDESFAPVSGSHSTIQGALKISKGKVIVKKIKIW